VRIALVCREVYPFGGGGIGQFVTAAARLLSEIAEVTVLTTSLFEQEYVRLSAAGDERLPPGVRFVFVPEPSVEEAEAWYHVMHCYSGRVHERLREVYPDGGPDLIEFPDYLGEGFVTLQAAEALDPFLERSRVCVRIHSTAEICELLDGFCKPDLPSRAVHELERFSLARADRVIWQGGDILDTYARFYGTGSIAPAVRIRYPYRGPAADPAEDASAISGPLRLLYVGRLERRKGVGNLVAAVRGLGRDDFRLTLVGGDTGTGPLGVSVREQLELAIADDRRVELRGGVDRAGVAEAIRAHDVVVIPSLWECWPYAALESFHLNRPVLGTPVGGLVELVAPGVSGWLASGTDVVALEGALGQLLDRRGELEGIVRGGLPVARGRELADDVEILDGYRALARTAVGRFAGRLAGRRAVGERRPLVSAVVPYYRGSRFVADAVESLFAQSYSRLEVVLVNDGSFADEDWVVAELAARLPVVVVTQMNQGLGAARNFGVEQCRGRYVLPLDCDNVVEPEFVARCVSVLERRPEVAYVTSWSRYVDEGGVPLPGADLGYEPLGNWARLVSEENVAGDAVAVIRRRIFEDGFRYSEELTSFEDWHFYRELARAGHYGKVIPERLIRYRVRPDSMQAEIAQPHRRRLHGEIEALIRQHAIRWTAPATDAGPGDPGE
jgi:glycogen synthase